MSGIPLIPKSKFRIRVLLCLILISVSCGSETQKVFTTPIKFTPNPVTASNGVCSTEVFIVDISGQILSLTSLQAVFRDPSNNSVTLVLSAKQLSNELDSQVVPANGSATLTLSFDAQAEGLSLPVEISVVAVGVNSRNIVHFVGSFQCL